MNEYDKGMETHQVATPRVVSLWDQLHANVREVFIEMRKVGDELGTDRMVIPEWFAELCYRVVEIDPRKKQEES